MQCIPTRVAHRQQKSPRTREYAEKSNLKRPKALEIKPCRQLNSAGVVHDVRIYAAEDGSAEWVRRCRIQPGRQNRRRKIEIRPVQEVFSVCAKVEIYPLGDPEFLRDGNVHFEKSGSDEIISARVADLAGLRLREQVPLGRIEPPVAKQRIACVFKVPLNKTAEITRAVVTVRVRAARLADRVYPREHRERSSRCKPQRSRNLPASDDVVEHRMHVRTESTAFSK